MGFLKKKWFVLLTIFLVVSAFCVKKFTPGIALGFITDYKPYTFEKVFSSPEMCADFGIDQNKSPIDYGFDFEEVDYLGMDSIALNGWYVKAKRPSNKIIAIIHGRTSNRLKTMKYLALVDTFDLDTAYNIFIPDLRNSGKSQPSKTAMGYKFGEDVTATLVYLKEHYEQDTFMLYGFSMGAMAISNALGRPDLKSKLKENDIFIEKVILDSPLSNVKETLRDQTSEVLLSSYFFDEIFELYSKQINGFGEKMRLSKLFPKDIPLLILQSKDDHLTLNDILSIELNEMKDFSNINVVYFEGPDHVRIFQDNRTREQYLDAVGDFLTLTSKQLPGLN